MPTWCATCVEERGMDTFGNQTSVLANHERHEGQEAVRAFSGECFRAFPDLRFATTSLHVGEEAIPVELGLSGTHTGPWFGILPTGRRFETSVHMPHNFRGCT